MSGSWLDQLQPASWRGVGFAVSTSTVRRGRRVAVHEYPWRNDVWVEDLGLGVRSVSFSGFVVGDDCFAQRDALLDACEAEGPGELVHPSLGSISVTLVTPAEATERKDLGRAVEVAFEFIQSSASVYPDASVSTEDIAVAAAADADTASAGDFLSGVGDALQEGASVVAAGVATAQTWVSQVQRVAQDASLISGAVAGLPGNLGRYASGARNTVLAGVTTAPGAIEAVVAARAAVDAATADMIGLAGTL